MPNVTVDTSLHLGWLRSPTFDTGFIFGIPLLCAASAGMVIWKPSLFVPVLLLDIWLLGYHHVISTFTRFTDRATRKEYHFLIYKMPFIVVAAVSLMVYTFGAWAIATLYLHWQWYHYLRQSEGISKAYAGKSARGQPLMPEPFNRVVFYLVPIASFLTMSSRGHEMFLGLPVETLVLPAALLSVIQYAAAIALLVWMGILSKAFYKGKASVAYCAYMLAHNGMFIAAYALIEDIKTGWLAINIWHNAQYIGFVWFFNANRFKRGIDPEHKSCPIFHSLSAF